MQKNNYIPLDVRKLKEIVRREGAKLNLRQFSDRDETLYTLALALSVAVKKIFYEKTETTFSNEPILEKLPITRFYEMMRVDGMEKFSSTTVFSSIEFAANEGSLERKEYLITMIVYLEKEFLPDFLRLLQYPYIDSDDEIEVLDGCGTLVNLIAGQYKREIGALGFKDLMMSPFTSHINTAPDGVAVPKGSTDKYQLSFEVEGLKRLVVEMVMPEVIPKWQFTVNATNKRILVIDDDLLFIKLIEPFLKANGFEVMVAFDGEDGLKKLNWSPHLIILDIQMPNMDGYEFIQMKNKIERERQIPVIVMTAKEGLVEVFKIEGAREYLVKPFRPEILLKCINRCIQ